MTHKPGQYEENYRKLESITESLNKDEIGVDDLVEKTREALRSAHVCMEILKKQKGEFKKLETDFSRLLEDVENDEEKGKRGQQYNERDLDEDPEEPGPEIGADNPF